MIAPKDDQIFNYMMPDENTDCCEKCNGETKDVDCDYYITYECLNCGHSPEPKEEV